MYISEFPINTDFLYLKKKKKRPNIGKKMYQSIKNMWLQTSNNLFISQL